MARKASGSEYLKAAQALLDRATTAEEMRTAQAVLLPLVLGLSLEQTALAIGRSPSAACSMRMRFCRVTAGLAEPPRSNRDLRNRAHATLEDERRLLVKVCGRARQAGPALVPQLKRAMEVELGDTVALSSVYRLLQRHGWRRIKPGEATSLPPPRKTGERRARPPARWAQI
jgi:hypothetical protein